MIKARKIIADRLKIVEYGCISHSLNLLAGDIMNSDSLKSLEGYCKQIIKEVTKSHIILATFNKIQKEKRGSLISLKLPVATRWGSILACLESLLENKYSLQQLVITEEIGQKLSPQVKKNCLDEDIFWIKIEKVCNILRPIVTWIHRLEGNHIYLSEVINAFNSLQKVFEIEVPKLPVSKNEEVKIHSFLKDRKQKVVSAAHYAANILDPKFQGEVLSTEEHSKGKKRLRLRYFKLDIPIITYH